MKTDQIWNKTGNFFFFQSQITWNWKAEPWKEKSAPLTTSPVPERLRMASENMSWMKQAEACGSPWLSDAPWLAEGTLVRTFDRTLARNWAMLFEGCILLQLVSAVINSSTLAQWRESTPWPPTSSGKRIAGRLSLLCVKAIESGIRTTHVKH